MTPDRSLRHLTRELGIDPTQRWRLTKQRMLTIGVSAPTAILQDWLPPGVKTAIDLQSDDGDLSSMALLVAQDAPDVTVGSVTFSFRSIAVSVPVRWSDSEDEAGLYFIRQLSPLGFGGHASIRQGSDVAGLPKRFASEFDMTFSPDAVTVSAVDGEARMPERMALDATIAGDLTKEPSREAVGLLSWKTEVTWSEGTGEITRSRLFKSMWHGDVLGSAPVAPSRAHSDILGGELQVLPQETFPHRLILANSELWGGESVYDIR